jgi:ABC-type branched-subunit amino acid transport system ATPase component
MTPSLSVEGLCKSFDGIHALDDFSCAVDEGETVGLIGPNGAGKTTLFNVLTGFLQADSGSATLDGRRLLGLAPHRMAGVGLARTFQNLRLIRRIGVLDNVLLAFQRQPGEQLSSVFFRPRACRQQEEDNRGAALKLLAHAALADKAGDPAEALSYGQQKLLSLVCCLATGAKLLLLDEPVAGIAPEMIEKILATIRALPAQGKSVLLIDHNLDAVAEVCDRVIFMDAGRKVSEGSPEEVRNDPQVIEAYLH